MFKNENSNTQLEYVYNSNSFSKNIKEWLEEIAIEKNVFNDFEGFNVANCSAVNNEIEEMTPSVNLNNAISLLQNDERLATEIDEYTIKVKNSSLYDTIDDDGNLLMDNTDANPNIRDALLEDSRDLLIQENNIFIAGTFVAVSILFTFFLFK